MPLNQSVMVSVGIILKNSFINPPLKISQKHKLEFDDTAMVIGKIIHNQIIKKGGNDERTN